MLQATDYITARRQATFSAVMIEEDDHVKKEQILARLDNSTFKVALDTAVAQAKAIHALVGQYQNRLVQNLRDAARDESLTR